jgi:AbrB family looped-hinge helix DNA binding protein
MVTLQEAKMTPQVELQESELKTVARPKPTLAAKAVVGDKGRIVIPAAIREAMGLEAGDEVDMYIENHELHLSTRWNRMDRAQERIRKLVEPGRSIVDEFLAERRTEALAE